MKGKPGDLRSGSPGDDLSSHALSRRNRLDGELQLLIGMADTPPLEGLFILRCAIYDPLERLQILRVKVSKMGVQDLIFGVVNMLHMLSYGHQGSVRGWWGY